MVSPRRKTALKDDDSGPRVVPLLLAVLSQGGTLAAFTEASHPTCEGLVVYWL